MTGIAKYQTDPKMLIANPLNSSALAFPILECFHIVGFAYPIGTIAIVDFSLLGIGMRRQTPPSSPRTPGSGRSAVWC